MFESLKFSDQLKYQKARDISKLYKCQNSRINFLYEIIFYCSTTHLNKLDEIDENILNTP